MKIDRENNFSRGPHKIQGQKDYLIGSIPYDISYGEDLKVMLQLDIQVETPMKLNLIDLDGNHFISREERETKEIHYMRLECYLDSYPVTTALVGKLAR